MNCKNEKNMDWNYLRTFHAVSETGSLAKAAERLAISHATAFRHMKAFEADLGARLFDKVQGRYCLTEAGAEILGLAQTVAAAFEDIERSGSGTDRQLKGRVRLTAPASFSSLHLPALVARFRSAYPEISVELLSSNEELNMSHRAAEVALRVTQSPPEHLVGRKLIDVPWGLYASSDYLERKGRPLLLADLSQHDLIGATGTLARRDGFSMIDRDYRAQVICRCDDLMAMAAFAGQGLGLALLPADVAPHALTRVFVLGDVPANQVWLLTHPDLRKVERVRALMQFLTPAIRDLPAFD